MLNNVQWIRTAADFSGSLPTFRKSWQAKGAVKQATAYVTAYGVYDFYIDGQKVGNRFMAPGWTYYPKRIQYQTYDVTGLLEETNTLSIGVGQGWAIGDIGFVANNHYFADQLSAFAWLDILFTDGTKTWMTNTADNSNIFTDFGHGNDVRAQAAQEEKDTLNRKGATYETELKRLEELRQMEENAGEKLAEDLLSRGETIKEILDKIAERAPGVVVDYTAKLRERI